MVSGWNLWVLLECIGVVIIIITFPYFLALFLAAASLFLFSFFLFSFFNVFFILVYVIFVKYIATVAQRTFKIVQISRSTNNWRAEASHPCLLNYPNFTIFIYLFVFIYISCRTSCTCR